MQSIFRQSGTEIVTSRILEEQISYDVAINAVKEIAASGWFEE